MSLSLSSSFFTSLSSPSLTSHLGLLSSRVAPFIQSWTQTFTHPWISGGSCPFWTALLIAYLALVRILRYRRRDTLAHKHGYTARESFSRMTDDEAMLILRDLALLEFPKMYSLSIFMALFKTYGIPTISTLLLSTAQLSSTPLKTSKRAADTGILLTEIVFNSPSSDRHIEALSRMNYLHDRYRNAGKISDDDMLYTLSLFALEPSRWTERYEWRGLTALERCATGVFFREMGRGMGIPFRALGRFMEEEEEEGKGGRDMEEGWGRDGLEWMEALEKWSGEYESDKMVYSESNQSLAKLTLELGLFSVPRLLRGFVMGIIGAVLEPRLRAAMAIPPPSQTHRVVLTTLVETRKFILRHLALPRPRFLRMKYFTDEADPTTGRYHAVRYRAHPWYVKPSFWSRWGVSALATRFLLGGGILPGGEDGDAYRPGGYKIREVGPDGLEGKGGEEMDRTRERLRRERRGGCPLGLA